VYEVIASKVLKTRGEKMVNKEERKNRISQNDNIIKIQFKQTDRRLLGTYEKGISAELCAQKYLVSKGYKIIGQRVRNQYGEIDILAQKKDDIVACEVKQRRTLSSSKTCITKNQIGRIARAFSLIISQRNKLFENYRIDVICFDIQGRIEHIENAFYIEEVA
jgi:putative endonuclease